ncbi:hypothetical protein FM076_20825 [Streptomyces albus subsp. chlorinus]|nr:hypothetical protein [Streptomyces albus subsp. chlorinus]
MAAAYAAGAGGIGTAGGDDRRRCAVVRNAQFRLRFGVCAGAGASAGAGFSAGVGLGSGSGSGFRLGAGWWRRGRFRNTGRRAEPGVGQPVEQPPARTAGRRLRRRPGRTRKRRR